MAAPRNLVNLKDVGKGFASRTVLDGITLGVNAGQRIGVVGRNGDGKSTLLRLIAGQEHPDTGTVTRAGGLRMATIAQVDELDGRKTIRQELIGARQDHEWAGDARFRSVLDGLLGGVAIARFPQGLDTVIGPLSGGERRRIALAKLLLDDDELLLLDEPTNHLDVEGVAWLAEHLAQRRGSLVVITHDRWFLDAVCTETWEVADTAVHQYDGGYAAYVLARAERDRQAAAREDRRQQLMRKELAWLRRGPPARTSKPKFRIEAANALIADEPEPRDGVELLRFASRRLGGKVLDAIDVALAYGDRTVLDRVTWRFGPGDRVALVGVNGSGKTSLIRLLAGELEPSSGHVERGETVRIAHLSQHTEEIPGGLRVLEALDEVKGRTTLADGSELTAGQMADRFGFRGAKGRTLVKDLSGGERRRLQLMRLLMGEPNVLILDEPTNDLDIDTLTALEDLLDAWAGTLIVVSHDRYFVERVTDDVYALLGEGGIRHLPGGIDEYLRRRHEAESRAATSGGATKGGGRGRSGAETNASPDGASGTGLTGGALRDARKQVQRLERQIEKLDQREAAIHEQMAEAATDVDRLRELTAELATVTGEKDEAEAAWMEASEAIEG